MPTLAFLLLLLLLKICSVFPVHSQDSNQANPTLPQKSDMITDHLQKINKPSIKIIQSPDGDVIDCVPSHLQPAFDHPLLKGKKPLDPPKRPKGVNPNEVAESSQLWSSSGESCPEGTIPIRRTTEQDVLRASSLERFGRKIPIAPASSPPTDHEYAYVRTNGADDQYYGAKANINIWEPLVVADEFSLAQMWVIAGSSSAKDLNTIEAGWQVDPGTYGDNNTRSFIFWTSDAYNKTGCYNLECSGFVQTNNRIALGGALTPVSSYNGTQSVINLLIWKDPASGNWWLDYGSDTVGYWPSHLFTLLNNYASMIYFGGEMVNTWPSGTHTSTQMGSGHFAKEGFGKAAFFRNLQGVDSNNTLIQVSVSNLHVEATNSNCYDIVADTSNDPDWGTYFYYGGPGRNAKCP